MKTCQVCLNTGRKQVGEQRGWTIWECSHCRFHYATPAANAEQPNYSEDYFDAFISRDESEDWQRFYNATLDTIRQYAPGKRLLDAGSGASMFCPHAAQRGWEVTAVDGSAAAIKHLSSNFGIPAKVADLNERHALAAALGSGCQFDAVNSFHVIEHLTNPRGYMEGIYEALVAGGCLHLGLPIYPWHRFQAHEILFRMGLANHHFILGLPDHVSFFDKRTIFHLLKQIGFRVRSLQQTGYVSLLDIANGWSSGGRLRRAAQRVIQAASPLTSRLGCFPHVVIIATKG